MGSLKNYMLMYIVIICLVSAPIVYEDSVITVKAATDKKSISNKDLNSAVKKAKKYTDLGKARLIKSNKAGILKVWAYGKSKGWSDSAIAGMIGNGIVESGLNAADNSGGYIGVYQVTGSRASSLRNYKCNHSKASNGACSKWWCQSMWAIDSGTGQFNAAKGNGVALNKNWDKQRKKLIKARSKYSSGDILIKATDLKTAAQMKFVPFEGTKTYKNLDNPYLAGAYFGATWEACQGMLYMGAQGGYTEPSQNGGRTGVYACKEAGARTAIAEIVAQAYGGIEPQDIKDEVDEEGKNIAEEVAKTAVSAGTMSESEFVQWKKMTDIKLEFGDIEAFNDDELYNLKTWQGDIEKDTEDSILVKGGRLITLIFGIIFEVWMLLIYLAYWFDRLNNFVDIDLLKIVTFGRLVISPTEEECTFSVRDLGKGETRTINHRHVIMVCIVGLAFGTLIISGKLFNIVNGIVTKALEWLS